MNQMYGFEGEVKTKYCAEMVDIFTDCFCYLPLAHVINDRVFCVHGGLFGDDNVTLDAIAKTDRVRQPPDSGIMCDVLWADPQPLPGRSPSKRGVSQQFGPDVTKNFLAKNNLDLVIRSHEVKEDGYEVVHGGKCITVFSAPNYCDQMGNKGAFVTLSGENCTPSFTTFEAVSHPDVKPMAFSSFFSSLGLM